MPRSLLTILQELERTRLEYGPGQAAIKISLLTILERSQLKTAKEIFRLHEHLCFLRAYPDNAAVLAQVVRMLERFSRRADLRRHKADLDDTGICGTVIHYPFFWPTARWIAERWPTLFYIDWENVENSQPLATAIALLLPFLESHWLRVRELEPKEAIKILCPSRTTDGVFYVRHVEQMPGNDVTREAFFDGLDVPLLLRPSRDTPSRTLAYYERSRIVFRKAPPERSRPDLLREVARPPRSVRAVSAREGQRLIDLARESMVTRERDLDNFAYGDPRDVRVVDDGDGLQWGVIGTLPARRPVLRATYGMLTLRNGVPIGYVGVDVLFKCADLSYNTFQTFRGGEAAFVFGRTLAAIAWLFGSQSFTMEPYQLGRRNDEGIESGAWWFYYKLGFRPRNPSVDRLARRELRRMKTKPSHRSSKRTLRGLAEDYLYFETPGVRAPYWPRVADLGAKTARHLAGLATTEREAPLPVCLQRALRLLNARLPRQASAEVQAAWKNWAPIVSILPDIERWSREERVNLAKVISAKGGLRDSDYLALFDQHPRLGSALRRLARA
ncbi:MAG TPA: hypothetical protein VEG60_03565 [Candidatus Binatia bacterium]|nr:hypothetical protein [Candidatus Binatia bacterium]